MFIHKLETIKNDLNNHKRDRYAMFTECVEKRLEKSLDSYTHDVELSLKNLENKNSMSVMNMYSRGRI